MEKTRKGKSRTGKDADFDYENFNDDICDDAEEDKNAD